MMLFVLLSLTLADPVAPAAERFLVETTEQPDFQRHVLPLMGRLGCNGRSCHGSFQGQGGFRLSLFGYDFEEDRVALTEGDDPRVNKDEPAESLILRKATNTEDHEGGERMTPDSWQYRLFLNWIKSGAPGAEHPSRLVRLSCMPGESVLDEVGAKTSIQVFAHWDDGTVEDVTCLSRFQTNDKSVADVDEEGLVVATGKGDTDIVSMYDNGVATVSVIVPYTPIDKGPARALVGRTKIDQHINDKLARLGVTPSEVCGDADFYRRVSLDIAGTLPTPEQVRAFLADKSPDKRARVIDELLETPAYASWWATKLCDFTGNAEAPFQAPFREYYAQQWYDWIRHRVEKNVPYDQIMTGIALGTGREENEDYAEYAAMMSRSVRENTTDEFAERSSLPHFWARSTVRKTEDKAIHFAHAFLGVRLECASCHKHPFDQWSKQDFDQFTVFFERVGSGQSPDSRVAYRKMSDELGLDKLNGGERRKMAMQVIKDGKDYPFTEVFLANAPKGKTAKPVNPKKKKNEPTTRAITPKLLGSDEVELAKGEDPRQAVVEWMLQPDNPYFASAIVNRVWAHYFGLGIINPPDDLNLAKPPSNPALLNEIVQGFVGSGYDLKWLHRTITNSDAYQRSSVPNESNKLDARNFSHALVRRLPAEVTVDALDIATSSRDRQSTLAQKIDQRAITVGGVGPTNGKLSFALKVFGQSDRATTCDCSRMNDPSVVQAVYMQNDQDIRTTLDRKDGWLSELASGLEASSPKQPKAPADADDRLADLDQRIAKIKSRLDKLDGEKRKDVEKTIAKLEKNRARLAEMVESTKTPAKKMKTQSLDTVIEEIYLRTVSRFPTDDEQRAARTYIKESPTVTEGVRDVLWAMLNTKEFITNH